MKPSLLLVDDEERILRSLSMLFRRNYQVRATTDAREALEWVRAQPPHVLVSDQRMPLMRGADLLREVRALSPNTMRILLTGYSEIDAIVASINEGEVFRFISKPWDSAELESTVAQAAQIAADLFATPPAAVPALAPAAQPIVLAAPAAARPVAAVTDVRAAAAATDDTTVLVLDDDAEVVKIVRDLLPGMAVHWANSIERAFQLLEQHRVGVIVSDMAVRGESVALALKMLKAQHPEIVTIALTPFEDPTVLIGLINQGQLYRYLPKPIRKGPLGTNLLSALRHHRSLRESSVLRSRFVVKEATASEDARLAARVMGYLSRLRLATPAR